MHHHTRSKITTLVLLFMLVFVGLVRPAQAAPDESRVLPQLKREAEEDPTKTFRVIVTRQEGKKSGDDKVKQKGGKKLKDMKHDAFVAEVTGKDLEELGQDEGSQVHRARRADDHDRLRRQIQAGRPCMPRDQRVAIVGRIRPDHRPGCGRRRP